MVRKGKFGKRPGAGGPLKGPNAKPKEVALKDEKFKGKSPSTKQGEAAKKQSSGDLGGLIFMCSGSTKADCFKYRVFGLNDGKKSLVEQVRKGMRLFLFDIDLRFLYGIYVAASNGSYKLERDAFRGAFPWQVRFSIQKDCLPLPEDVFQAAIKENYLDRKKFNVELTTEQVHKLVRLFRPLPVPAGLDHSPPRPRLAPVDKFEVAATTKAHRYPENNRYMQDGPPRGRRLSPRSKYERHLSPRAKYERHLSPRAKYERRLSPRANYETSYMASDVGRLPPLSKYETSKYESLPPISKYETSRYESLPPISKYESLPPISKYETSMYESLPPISKYETGYTESDSYRAERQIPSYSQSLTKYAQLYTPEERQILDGRLSDDHYLGRELRLQQELTQHSQVGAGSLVPAPLSLSTYSAEPVRTLSDLRQPRARDELYPLYSQGSALIADADPLHRQRLLVPDVRADALDRRLAGIDPLVDSSLAYSGSISGDLLRSRLSNDTYPSSAAYGRLQRIESGSGIISGGITGASGLAYRGDLLPHSRYY